MSGKYSSLLVNVPVRHSFGLLTNKTKEEVMSKLKTMAETELNNFFVLGSVDTIALTLQAASELKMLGTKKFSWSSLTLDEAKSVPCTTNCVNLKLVFMHPKPKASTGSIEGIRSSYGVEAKPDIDVAFYFDAGMKALMAIR